MEDLLWSYPEKLLNEPLTQFKRQQRSAVGRSDLIFVDRLGRLLVVEIKHGKLGRGAIDQIHDYFGMVKREHPDKPVELMVVANVIPSERRLACEKYDIEPREISEKRFRDVAAEVGYAFASEAAARPPEPVPADPRHIVHSDHAIAKEPHRWSFTDKGGTAGADSFLSRCDDEGKQFFSALIERQEAARNRVRITWNHESGFSMHFYFHRLGFVEMVWGFPVTNRAGKETKPGQRLVLPFDFAAKKGAPHSFLEGFADKLAALALVTPRGKRPSIAINGLTPAESAHILDTIFEFAEKASSPLGTS